MFGKNILRYSSGLCVRAWIMSCHVAIYAYNPKKSHKTLTAMQNAAQKVWPQCFAEAHPFQIGDKSTDRNTRGENSHT